MLSSNHVQISQPTNANRNGYPVPRGPKPARRAAENPCANSVKIQKPIPIKQSNTETTQMRATQMHLIATLIFILATQANTEPINPSDIRVIDGDTIRVYHQHPNVRLVGFNAPETRNAACHAEFELGSKATRRLRDIVKAGNLTFEYVRCSCPDATQGTPSCNWGRDCGTLKSNGKDVGAILIEEGLAVPFVCGATHCPRTPKPWCH